MSLMSIRLSSDYGGSGEALLCPTCGNACMHHHRVDVFARREDANDGLHVAVEGQHAVVDTLLVGNPSSRRHGVTISFVYGAPVWIRFIYI